MLAAGEAGGELQKTIGGAPTGVSILKTAFWHVQHRYEPRQFYFLLKLMKIGTQLHYDHRNH